MKLSASQLNPQLKQPLGGRCFWIASDEIVLREEARSAIRQAAIEQQYCPAAALNLDEQFDWPAFYSDINNVSLFADRELIELTTNKEKPGKTLFMPLLPYLENPSSDRIILLITSKIDTRTQKTQWFQSLLSHCFFVPLWPLDNKEWLNWLQQQATLLKLSIAKHDLQQIAEHCEGNLLAGKQLLLRLSLAQAEENQKAPIASELVNAQLHDMARFNVFDLTEACLTGKRQRILRQLQRLREEGIEAILVLWALARLCRVFARLLELNQDRSTDNQHPNRRRQVFSEAKIWQEDQMIALEQHAKRHPIRHWYRLLEDCLSIECQLKGLRAGDPWLTLTRLALAMSTLAV